MASNLPSHIIIERRHLYTAFGMRLWDAVMQRPADGLIVTGQRVNASNDLVGRQITGRLGQSGTYVFLGLHPAENTSDAQQEHALPPKQAVITVTDPRGRFVPAAFTVMIPHHGVFTGTPALLPDGLQAEMGVHLFAAPARPTPEGMAVIHGQLVVGEAAENPPPAKFALVRVISEELRLSPSNGGGNNGGLVAVRVPVTYYGLTDQNGLLNLPLPYPAIEDDATKIPLSARTFTLQLEVYYDPSAQSANELPPSIKLDANERIPNYTAILSQPRARIATQYDAPTETLTIPNTPEDYEVQLAYEVPFTLRTPAAQPNLRNSRLRILPS